MATVLPATGRLRPIASLFQTKAGPGVDIIPNPSPNFGPRRHGCGPDMVLLHHTAMESCEAALARLCDPEAEVSAHYLIGERGGVFQLVEEDMRAWHAGAGAWGGVTDVNSHSIGIELVNPGPFRGFPPFPEAQMATLEHLLAGIADRWTILPERVIAHSDMAPDRKFDPGPKFDWQRLARAGLSIWPDAGGGDPELTTFRECAVSLGYAPEHGDETLLAAFRLRFRPQKTGPVDQQDMCLIQNLAHRFPVDRVI